MLWILIDLYGWPYYAGLPEIVSMIWVESSSIYRNDLGITHLLVLGCTVALASEGNCFLAGHHILAQLIYGARIILNFLIAHVINIDLPIYFVSIIFLVTLRSLFRLWRALFRFVGILCLTAFVGGALLFLGNFAELQLLLFLYQLLSFLLEWPTEVFMHFLFE